MSKCIRCGGGFLTRRRIKLKDSEICGKCFNELGFDKSYYLISDQYSYEDIKDGLDAYYVRQRKEKIKEAALSSVSVRINGAQERDLVCTEEEREIFDEICSFFDDNDLDREQLRLVRVSDNYLTMKLGEWDLVCYKYTPRAKWLSFPTIEKRSERHEITSPDEALNFADLLTDSIEHIKKYSD